MKKLFLFLPTFILFLYASLYAQTDIKGDWNGYTSFGIPTVVYNIPDNTAISLGIGDNFVSAVGSFTEFTVTRINRNL